MAALAAVEGSAWTLRLPHNAASERWGKIDTACVVKRKDTSLRIEDWKRSARSSCGGCRAALRDDECCDDTRVRRHLPLSANRREEEPAR